MEKRHSVMPIVAGSLAIASAGFKLLVVLGLMIASTVAIIPASIVGVSPLVILLIIIIPLAILPVLALVGGIYAIQRKKWGLALAGSIAAFLPFFSSRDSVCRINSALQE